MDAFDTAALSVLQRRSALAIDRRSKGSPSSARRASNRIWAASMNRLSPAANLGTAGARSPVLEFAVFARVSAASCFWRENPVFLFPSTAIPSSEDRIFGLSFGRRTGPNPVRRFFIFFCRLTSRHTGLFVNVFHRFGHRDGASRLFFRCDKLFRFLGHLPRHYLPFHGIGGFLVIFLDFLLFVRIGYESALNCHFCHRASST